MTLGTYVRTKRWYNHCPHAYDARGLLIPRRFNLFVGRCLDMSNAVLDNAHIRGYDKDESATNSSNFLRKEWRHMLGNFSKRKDAESKFHMTISQGSWLSASSMVPKSSNTYHLPSFRNLQSRETHPVLPMCIDAFPEGISLAEINTTC